MAKFIKGLLFGTLVGAMATAYLSAKKKMDMEETVRLADELRKKVMKKATKLSAVTQKSYEHIVETVLDEYRDWKNLSADELNDLKKTLKAGWKDVSKMLKSESKKR